MKFTWIPALAAMFMLVSAPVIAEVRIVNRDSNVIHYENCPTLKGKTNLETLVDPADISSYKRCACCDKEAAASASTSSWGAKDEPKDAPYVKLPNAQQKNTGRLEVLKRQEFQSLPGTIKTGTKTAEKRSAGAKVEGYTFAGFEIFHEIEGKGRYYIINDNGEKVFCDRANPICRGYEVYSINGKNYFYKDNKGVKHSAPQEEIEWFFHD